MEKFQKLDIKLDTHNKNNQLDRFIIAPLERGMGTTIGNSLRRILLSYIPGASIFAIKIAGVAHEYQAIDGVKEDVTEIILNLKNLVIKKSDGSIIFDDSLDINESNASLKIMSWPTLKIKKKGKGEILASDFEIPPGFDIVNKNLHIMSVTNEATEINLEVYIQNGIGYKTFKQNQEVIRATNKNLIPVDSNFTPIVKVGYAIDEYKLTKDKIADRLTLEIATNGAIEPAAALAFAAKILIGHLNPFANVVSKINEDINVFEEKKHQEQVRNETIQIPIEDLNLSVRSFNCLKRANINYLNDLTAMTRTDVKKIKNLGNKSLREIYNKVKDFGLSFKEDSPQ